MNYLLLALALAIGGLVLALRIQGGRLHQAQIKLLLTVIDRGQAEKDATVSQAREALTHALKDYYDAEGK